MEYIDIDKDSIPYEFDITIKGESFTFEVFYNTLKDYFTLNLLRNGEILVLGEKVVYAKPLFLTSRHKDIPKVNIIPYDLTNKAEKVTFENFNQQVFLFMVGD